MKVREHSTKTARVRGGAGRVRTKGSIAERKRSGTVMDLYDEPGHLIRRAQQIAVSMFHSMMGHGVTPIQYCALRVIQNNPGIDQVTLARLCALDTSTAADLAVRLEVRGLVERTTQMESKRSRLLILTPRGEALIRKLIPFSKKLSEKLLKGLDHREQIMFRSLLKKFVHLNNQKSRAPLGQRAPNLATVKDPISTRAVRKGRPEKIS